MGQVSTDMLEGREKRDSCWASLTPWPCFWVSLGVTKTGGSVLQLWVLTQSFVNIGFPLGLILAQGEAPPIPLDLIVHAGEKPAPARCQHFG